MPKTLTIELPDEVYAVLEELAAEDVKRKPLQVQCGNIIQRLKGRLWLSWSGNLRANEKWETAWLMHAARGNDGDERTDGRADGKHGRSDESP